MQSTTSNLEFTLNVNLRIVKPDFMQSMAVKLNAVFKRLSAIGPCCPAALAKFSLIYF